MLGVVASAACGRGEAASACKIARLLSCAAGVERHAHALRHAADDRRLVALRVVVLVALIAHEERVGVGAVLAPAFSAHLVGIRLGHGQDVR